MKNRAFITVRASQTRALGEETAKKTLAGKGARVFGLAGNLGGGKTTFLQGFARGLGIKEKITSPTFVIVKKFPIPSSRFRTFYHIDCYRLRSPKDLLDLGFREIAGDPQNVVCVEWADKIKSVMPARTAWIRFRFVDEKTRKLVVK